MVRALASHQCGQGSIPGPSTISGLSLCWFSSVLRGFFSGFSGFPPSPKTNIQLIPAGCSCAPRSHIDCIAAARGTLFELRHCCTLRQQLASFALLRSALICLRGTRSTIRKSWDFRNTDIEIENIEGAIY